jgi:hypothetical protein
MSAENNDELRLPDGARWVHLTDERLAADPQGWHALVTGFEPFAPPRRTEGRAMRAWLLNCVNDGEMEMPTHVVYNDHLLGFFSVDPESYLRLVEGEHTSTARAPLMSNIVRSRQTRSGFGELLLREAVAVALEFGTPENPVESLVVQPANNPLREMWERKHFRATQQPDKMFIVLSDPESQEA